MALILWSSLIKFLALLDFLWIQTTYYSSSTLWMFHTCQQVTLRLSFGSHSFSGWGGESLLNFFLVYYDIGAFLWFVLGILKLNQLGQLISLKIGILYFCLELGISKADDRSCQRFHCPTSENTTASDTSAPDLRFVRSTFYHLLYPSSFPNI